MNNIFVQVSNFDKKIIENNLKKYISDYVFLNPEDLKKQKKFFLLFIDQEHRSRYKHNENIDSYLFFSEYKYGCIKYPFSNKIELYDFFKTNKYFPENISVYSFNVKSKIKKIKEMMEKYKILIARPENESYGNKIKITNDFDSMIKFIIKNKKNFIVGEYIKNPLLLDGKKFHVRYYVIFMCNKNLTKIAKLKHHKIVSSDKKYLNENFEDKDIHNIHSEKNIFFPSQIKNGEILDKKIDVMLKYVFKETIDYINYYEKETENGFDVLGLDIMFDDEDNPYLLEINQQVTFADKNNDFFMNSFFDGIFSFIFTDEKENDNFKEIMRRKY